MEFHSMINFKFLFYVITAVAVIVFGLFVFTNIFNWDMAYAVETLDGHTGIKIIKHGVFDAKDEGDLTNQLFVGEKYWFYVEYKNELTTTYDIEIFTQMIDKNKDVSNVLRKIEGHSIEEPFSGLEHGFEWTPEYPGKFEITTVLTTIDDPSINSTAQYDFVVLDRPSLKHQIKNNISINDIICKDVNHYTVERENGKIACVYLYTAERLGWKSIDPDVVVFDSSLREFLIDSYKDMPEVVAFYAKYDNAQVSVREDHVSYFAGRDNDDFRIRMNLEFDKNFEIENIELHCYVNREHQSEVPQNFILKYLKDFTCDEYGSHRNEN